MSAGGVRHFTFDRFRPDEPDCVPGMLLVGPRARYVIIDARPMESRIWHDRWALTVRRVADDTPIRAPWCSFVSYRRGEGPWDFADLSTPEPSGSR